MKPPSRLATSIGLIVASLDLAGLATPAQAAWNDVTTTSWTQNTIDGINSSGLSVGNGITSTFTRAAFKSSATAGGAVLLTPLVSGAPCSAGKPTDSGKIPGVCQDSNGVPQGVVWDASNSLPPTQEQPLPGILGLAAGVRTEIFATNNFGTGAGVSIDGSDTATPVTWSTAGVPSMLNAPLLSVNTNCTVADINNATPPAVVGNCPAGATGGGKSQAVYWSAPGAAYILLLLPTGANSCAAIEINDSGQIMGECIFTGTGTPDVYKVVQWSSATASPSVLQTVNNNTALRTSAVAMNASGQIAFNHEVSGGFILPGLWNPATGSNGIGIAAPAGSSEATATAIADNGSVAICAEVAGNEEAAVSHGGAAPILVAPLSGGHNDCATAISKNGTYIAGYSDGPGTNNQAINAVEELTP